MKRSIRHRLLHVLCTAAASLLLTAACARVVNRWDTGWIERRPADTDVRVRVEPDAPPEAALPRAPASGPLVLTLKEAVLLSLENNRALVVERLNPAIQETFEAEERAVFDPVTSAEVSLGRDKEERAQAAEPEIEEDFTTDTARGGISLEQYFPTGTRVALRADTRMDDSSILDTRAYESRIGMTITQALLRGYGVDTNLARLRQARLETLMSEFELRGFTEALVAEVELTYWDLALARRQIEIVEESLKVARQQLSETQQLISVGRLPKAELAAVQAEVALQEQALIRARADEEIIRLRLIRLLNPTVPAMWDVEIDLAYEPTLPEIRLDEVRQHVALAQRMRPILNEARLEILTDSLELVRTKNGLLPLLDLFITLGKTGYATSFGDSAADIPGDGYDASAGLRFSYPNFNREARALHKRALLSREQTEKSLANLSQLVEVDVRTAYIDVNRTRQQIAASTATRRFNEEKLRIETEKLRVGRSTSFLVAQAQRDLLASRIAEVKALVDYIQALVDLYRLDGSLLERRGIVAPGREPVEIEKQKMP